MWGFGYYFDTMCLIISGVLLLVLIAIPLVVMVLAIFNPSAEERHPGPLDHRRAPCKSCGKLMGIDDTYCPHCRRKVGAA